MNNLDPSNMNWRLIAERLKQTASQPDHALLIELAACAVLLAWMAH